MAFSLLMGLHCARPASALTGAEARWISAVEGTEFGAASWYGGDGDGFSGRRTASGEIYDPAGFTCAHRTLPFGTVLLVQNEANGHRVMLRVNDRGPYLAGRMLDVSPGAAAVLGFLERGVAQVSIRVALPRTAGARPSARAFQGTHGRAAPGSLRWASFRRLPGAGRLRGRCYRNDRTAPASSGWPWPGPGSRSTLVLRPSGMVAVVRSRLRGGTRTGIRRGVRALLPGWNPSQELRS